jgi:hypothetical protein
MFFEPGKEILLVQSTDEVVSILRDLPDRECARNRRPRSKASPAKSYASAARDRICDVARGGDAVPRGCIAQKHCPKGDVDTVVFP